jgi:oligopeptidase A
MGELRTGPATTPLVKELEELRAFAKATKGAPEADNSPTGISPSGPSESAKKSMASATKNCDPTFPCPRCLTVCLPWPTASLMHHHSPPLMAKPPSGIQTFATSRWLNDAGDEPIAHFYFDPYSRPAEKRGGAWMDECINRGKFKGLVRLPVAYLVCNQPLLSTANPA